MNIENANHIDLHSKSSRTSLAKMVMHLLSHWALSSEDQLTLLGLNPESRSSLKRYREGQPFADHRDLLDRASHLLGIHKSLRIIFPHNQDIAYSWMSRRNRNFKNHTPTEIIREYGFQGLLMVRAYLDRERGK